MGRGKKRERKENKLASNKEKQKEKTKCEGGSYVHLRDMSMATHLPVVPAEGSVDGQEGRKRATRPIREDNSFHKGPRHNPQKASYPGFFFSS